MNIFRLFFVSTVLIPVLVVVATSDETGVPRLRRPRNVLISEDGTRTDRRHGPVTITDKNCPSLGCTGNLTSNEYNGKRILASPEGDGSPKERSGSTFHPDHNPPLKLDIKSIKNSTRVDYEVSSETDEATARGIISYAILVSWAFFWTWRVILTVIIIYTINWWWGWGSNKEKKGSLWGGDMIEYYIKLGKDEKHPFHNYGGGWNPTFGISLKSKVEELKEGWGWPQQEHHGWSGWPPPQQHGWQGWPQQQHHGWPGWASSYHDYHHQQPSGYYPEEEHDWSDLGPAPGKKKKGEHPEDELEHEKEEEETNLRHKFDRAKGYKWAKKYTKKYGKKAHKYGLRPSKFSYLYDENGALILGGAESGFFAWKRAGEPAQNATNETKNDSSNTTTTKP